MPRAMRLVVADDGRGFSPEARAGGEEGHLGLSLLEELVRQVDSTLTVSSREGEGTRSAGSAVPMIRVLLADDHGVLRDGLGRVIASQPDIEFVGAAADGAEAVAHLPRREPDVVLMDLEMPVLDGIEATRAIVADAPAPPCSCSPRSPTGAAHRRSARRGRGRLPAEGRRRDEVVPTASAQPRAASSPLDPRAARTLLDASPRPIRSTALSAREREVLALLRRGAAEQAHRPPARDQREDREVAPHQHLPAARRDRPRAGHPLGGASGTRRVSRRCDQCPVARATGRRAHWACEFGSPVRSRMRAAALVALAVCALVAAVGTAGAKDARPEGRVSGVCGAGAAWELRLKADDGRIELEFEVDRRPRRCRLARRARPRAARRLEGRGDDSAERFVPRSGARSTTCPAPTRWPCAPGARPARVAGRRRRSRSLTRQISTRGRPA